MKGIADLTEIVERQASRMSEDFISQETEDIGVLLAEVERLRAKVNQTWRDATRMLRGALND